MDEVAYLSVNSFEKEAKGFVVFDQPMESINESWQDNRTGNVSKVFCIF